MSAALELYERALLDARPLWLRYGNGRRRRLALATWQGSVGPADRSLLARCTGPTLDIGCGPGRLAAGVRDRGIPVLGVDVSRTAVGSTRARGAPAVHCSVFDPLPAEGQWQVALLADGNIGIGGDPLRLLRRCAELVQPGGRVLVEVEPPGGLSGPVSVRLERTDQASSWFPWAHLSLTGLASMTTAAGLRPVESWQVEGRWFARLQTPGSRAG